MSQTGKPAARSAASAGEARDTASGSVRLPPGAERPRRLLPRLRYELIDCGLHGHELVGTDLGELPADYRLAAIEDREDGIRWHRCLRCDSWLPLPPPASGSRRRPPPLEEIEPPLRGRPLRDRFVLRTIAVDRVLHFLILGVLAASILLFAQHKSMLQGDYTRVLNRLQGAVGGPLSDTQHAGLLRDLDRLFAVSTGRLYLYGLGIAAYAAINGVEAVGLWRARRWAEYLTLFEVVVLLPLEIHELTVRVSPLKILTLLINLAVVAYLIWAHRLLGVRGGGRAEQAQRDADMGWPAIRRATPWLTLPTSASAPSPGVSTPAR